MSKFHIFGKTSEIKAVKYLKFKKYKIIETNYFFSGGEIDIIAKFKNTYIFIEVKARTTLKFGYPQEAVDRKKQANIKKGALYFLKQNRIFEYVARFDVIEILDDEINHIENAFD